MFDNQTAIEKAKPKSTGKPKQAERRDVEAKSLSPAMTP